MWGSEQSQQSILINEKLFGVRENLWDFLHLARCSYPNIPLWVDAICINQESNSERGHQVTLMGEIYARSKEVLVYLGSGPSDIPQALARLRAIKSSRTAQCNPEVRGPVRSSEYPLRKPFEPCQLHGLAELCQLPYWKRVWIKQEIVNGGNSRLHWGSYYCAWEGFARMLKALFTYDSTFSRSLPDLRSQIKNSEAIPLALLFLSRPPSNIRILEDPITFIPKFCFSDCTDVRDRVYGLLGLTLSGNTFPVEYSCTPVELLIKTLVHCKKQRECRYQPNSQKHHTRLGELLSLGAPLARALNLGYAEMYSSPLINPLIMRPQPSPLDDSLILELGTLWSRCTKVKDTVAAWSTECPIDSMLALSGLTFNGSWSSRESGIERSTSSFRPLFRKGDVLVKLDCEALFLVCRNYGHGLATPMTFLTNLQPLGGVKPERADELDRPAGSAGSAAQEGSDYGRLQSFHCDGIESIRLHDHPFCDPSGTRNMRDSNRAPSVERLAFLIPMRVVLRLVALFQSQWPVVQTDGSRSRISLQEGWLPRHRARSTFILTPGPERSEDHVPASALPVESVPLRVESGRFGHKWTLS